MAKGDSYFSLDFSAATMNTSAIIPSKVDMGGWMPVEYLRRFKSKINQKRMKNISYLIL
jgi:hypothetical protein